MSPPSRVLSWLSALLAVPIVAHAGNGTFDADTGKFNMVVSVRWNATQAQLDDIAAEFQSASGILLDATEGEHQFGIILIANNSTASNAADYWILRQGGRSGAPTCRFGQNGRHIEMMRGTTDPPAARYDEVIVHETAHYVYCVRDEYEGPATGGCGAATCDDNPVAECIGNTAQPTCLMEGPDANDSEFCWSGNHDPDQDTEQHCDHCESCWDTMAGAGFGLTAPTAAPLDAAPAADEIAAIFLDDIPRIVLVIDRSGSMSSQSRMEDAQKAAKLVVDLVETGTYLGVVSFSTTTGLPDYDLQTIDDGGDRTNARNAIEGLTPDLRTNYSAGLQLALSEFTRVGLAAANKSVIFLSDGKNNEPGGEAAADVALADAIDDLNDESIVVNTIGVGDELDTDDEDRLRGMADDTSGEYSRTPVPFVPIVPDGAQVSSIDDYKPTFARYWASSEERAQVMNSTASLGFDEEQCDAVVVDAATVQATFVISWRGNVGCAYPDSPDYGMKFRLVAPDSSEIDPSMSGQPGILFVQDCDSQYAFFKISAPALTEGKWLLCSRNRFEAPAIVRDGDGGGGGGIDVAVVSQVFSRSAEIWATCNTRPERRIGLNEDLFVEATAYAGAALTEVDSGEPPAGEGEFVMTGTLLTPAGVEALQFELHDLGDPDSGDQEDGDGIFTGRVPREVLDTHGTGTYKVVVDIANTGGAFYAGARSKPIPGEELPPIPHFERSCSASAVYDQTFVAINEEPEADAGGPYVVECQGLVTAVSLDGSGSSDPDPGDVLSFEWTTDCPGASFDDPNSPTPILNVDTSCACSVACTVFLTVSDGLESATSTSTVEISACNPPDCTAAVASVTWCWPPNHKFVPVDVLGVTDPDGDPVAITIDGITQDEPVRSEGRGSGKTCPDAVMVDADGDGNPETAGMRCERDGTGNGRVYRVHFTATDVQGFSCEGSVDFCVPHDRGQGDSCLDDGQAYDSLVCPDGGAGGRPPTLPYSLPEFDALSPEPLFLRGDVDWDEETAITDGIVLLERLFLTPEPVDCQDAADVNDDGVLDVSDAITLFSHLFVGGFSPSPPTLEIGADPTLDNLSCE